MALLHVSLRLQLTEFFNLKFSMEGLLTNSLPLAQESQGMSTVQENKTYFVPQTLALGMFPLMQTP